MLDEHTPVLCQLAIIVKKYSTDLLIALSAANNVAVEAVELSFRSLPLRLRHVPLSRIFPTDKPSLSYNF
jgi:hypothetical protein